MQRGLQDRLLLYFHRLKDSFSSLFLLSFQFCLCSVLLITFDETNLFQCSYARVITVRLQDSLHGYRRGGMHFHSRNSVPVFRLLVQFAVSQYCFAM